MQITFDSTDPREVAALAALAAALGNPSAAHAVNPTETVAFAAPAPIVINGQGPVAFADSKPRSVIADPPGHIDAVRAVEIAPDAAAAFGGTLVADAGAAFGSGPPLPSASIPAPPAALSAATPPAPPSGLPAAPATASPSEYVTGVEVDRGGLPWDARIHSGPPDKRPKTGDGYWRKRRGVTDSEVAQVEAQLRQTMGAPAVVAPLAPPTTPTPPAPPSIAAVPPPPASSVPVPPPAAVPAAETPAGGAAVDFAGLIQRLTDLQTRGGITVGDTVSIAQELGLTSLRDLAHRPDLIPAFVARLPA